MIPLAKCPPASESVTDYDRAHVATYLRLLDAEADGAPAEEAATVIFGGGASRDPASRLTQHRTHLARARWMSREGYLRLAQARQHTE